jgi:hypothetical protein
VLLHEGRPRGPKQQEVPVLRSLVNGVLSSRGGGARRGGPTAGGSAGAGLGGLLGGASRGAGARGGAGGSAGLAGLASSFLRRR